MNYGVELNSFESYDAQLLRVDVLPCKVILYNNVKQPLIDLLFKKLLAFHLVVQRGLLRRMRGEVTNLLTRQDLVRVRTNALRQKVWFKVASRLERGIVDLTIRCVEKIKSPVLARIVSKIIKDLEQVLESNFLKTVENVGHKIVGRLCKIALSWGNARASTWRDDVDFVRFLGVSALNLHTQVDGLIG